MRERQNYGQCIIFEFAETQKERLLAEGFTKLTSNYHRRAIKHFHNRSSPVKSFRIQRSSPQRPFDTGGVSLDHIYSDDCRPTRARSGAGCFSGGRACRATLYKVNKIMQRQNVREIRLLPEHFSSFLWRRNAFYMFKFINCAIVLRKVKFIKIRSRFSERGAKH